MLQKKKKTLPQYSHLLFLLKYLKSYTTAQQLLHQDMDFLNMHFQVSQSNKEKKKFIRISKH
jgi:hypothetical protein